MSGKCEGNEVTQWPRKTRDWVGKQFRNKHTGRLVTVWSAYFRWVTFGEFRNLSHRWTWQEFKKHHEPIREA